METLRLLKYKSLFFVASFATFALLPSVLRKNYFSYAYNRNQVEKFGFLVILLKLQKNLSEIGNFGLLK